MRCDAYVDHEAGSMLEANKLVTYGSSAFTILEPNIVRHPSHIIRSILHMTKLPESWTYMGCPRKGNQSLEGHNDLFDGKVWIQFLPYILTFRTDDASWSVVLHPRDLLAGEHDAYGVEVFNPQLVARKFIMYQNLSIPFVTTQNNPLDTRPHFKEPRVHA